MSKDEENDDDDIHKMATLPPPHGEDDAYSAATKVGPMPESVMKEIMRVVEHKAAEMAQRSSEKKSRPPDLRNAPGAEVTAPAAAYELLVEKLEGRPLPPAYEEDNAAPLLGLKAAGPLAAPRVGFRAPIPYDLPVKSAPSSVPLLALAIGLGFFLLGLVFYLYARAG